MSRRAGMIFTGTVLAAPSPAENDPSATTPSAGARPGPANRPGAGPVPAVQSSFQVDDAIAGVAPGQVLTIREWTGAWSMHPPMRQGQRLLLFLYPPSRLGLTSPVGGSLGQVPLDATGRNVIERGSGIDLARRSAAPPVPAAPADQPTVALVQITRAIRSARSEYASSAEARSEEK